MTHTLLETKPRSMPNGLAMSWRCSCGKRILRTRGANSGGLVYAEGNAKAKYHAHVAATAAQPDASLPETR